MRITPFVKLAKLVLLQPQEHKWVTNILKAADSNPKVRKEVLEWNPLKSPGSNIINNRDVLRDCHGHHSIRWSIYMTQMIMKDGCRTRISIFGHKFEL